MTRDNITHLVAVGDGRRIYGPCVFTKNPSTIHLGAVEYDQPPGELPGWTVCGRTLSRALMWRFRAEATCARCVKRGQELLDLANQTTLF